MEKKIYTGCFLTLAVDSISCFQVTHSCLRKKELEEMKFFPDDDLTTVRGGFMLNSFDRRRT